MILPSNSFSFFSATNNRAPRSDTDDLVVGALLSAEAVTFYAIGGRFIEYLGQLSASFAQTFMPMASNLAAQGRQDQLRCLLISKRPEPRASLLVSLTVGGALFFRGSTFIGLWMGHQYAQPSGVSFESYFFRPWPWQVT